MVQQPGAGMFTYEGPGPSGSVTTAVRVLPASVARMVIGPVETRDTHRILLATFGRAGACRALGAPHKMATMSPAAPSTCGLAVPGGLNPARAQTGSGLTGGWEVQLSAVAVAAGFGAELLVHAVSGASAVANAASAARARYLMTRRYGGSG